MSYYESQREFKVLLGKTITAVERTPDELKIACSDGTKYIQYHSQDCCESVVIEDVIGDLDDLIGEPVLEAEEVTSNANPEGVKVPEYQDSFTWTFYKLGTRKGSVTIRWYGESNGHYSESVDFAEVK